MPHRENYNVINVCVLQVFVVGFFVATFRRRQSAIEGRVEDSDIEDSDEELVTA